MRCMDDRVLLHARLVVEGPSKKDRPAWAQRHAERRHAMRSDSETKSAPKENINRRTETHTHTHMRARFRRKRESDL